MREKNTNSPDNLEAILQQAANKRHGSNLKNTYPAYIVLVVFVIFSFLIRSFFKEKVETDNRIAFDKAVNSVTMRIDNKYRSNLQVLTSIQGLYDAYVDVVRDYFKLYSSVPTSTNASISSLMYVPNIKNAEVGEHVFNMQRQGLWDYNVHPEQQRDEYYPIEFIEPIDKNIQHAGFDYKSDHDVNAAIDKARDNNIITVTTSLNTLNNANKGGFYLIAPVYNRQSARATQEDRRNNFLGVVMEEINTEHFFKDALGGNFPSDTAVVFEFVEKTADGEHVMFKSKNYVKDIIGNDSYTGLQGVVTLKFGDRKIEARFATVPNFNGWFTKNLHNISFAIAILLTLAFFGFVYSVTTSRARAVDLAERMTRSQRRIVDSSKDIISIIDLDGNWKSLNPAAKAIFGIEPDKLLGKSITELFANGADLADLHKTIENVVGEETVRNDYEMKTKTGEIKWLNWNFTISKRDQLIYAIGRDVTLEKLAAEEAILRSKQMKLAEQFTREASEFKSLFMTKLSHQMRNSLTGIIGYLQLLGMKIYDTEEEEQSFISFAEESAEELFTFVSDMIDVAKTEDEKTDIKIIKLNGLLKDSVKEYTESQGKNLAVSMMDEGESDPKIVSDETIAKRALRKIYEAVTPGIDNVEIQVAATENPYEGATEIQMLTIANPLVAELIEIYKANANNIIKVLNQDKEDVMLNLALASSIVRMMNGTMSVETLGPNEGNIVQITLPLGKKTV